MSEVEHLRQRVRELEHLLSTHMRSDGLEMESGVSSRTGKPFMHMRWGDQAGQFTPEEARAHASRIFDAAAAAEFDAALVKALTSEMALEYDKAVRFLGLMREARGGSDQSAMKAVESPRGEDAG